MRPAFLSLLYAWHVRDTIQQVSALLYAGSAIGAVFSGDLISLFIFWEGTAIASVFLIWARRTEGAYATGIRYLVIQVASGVIHKGDEIVSLPSGKTSKVKAIDTYDGALDEAFAPMSVTLRLEDEIDVSRGDMIVHPDALPVAGQKFEANVVWMSETALDAGSGAPPGIGHGALSIRIGWRNL